MTQQSTKTSYVLPAILAFGPILLLALAFIMSTLFKAAAPEVSSAEAGLFGEQSSTTTFANTLSILFGAVGFITLFPGIIIGSIMFVKRKNRRKNYY